MSNLNERDKEIILQYCFGNCDSVQVEQARKLIADDAEALAIYEQFSRALKPLDALRAESCPDELAELTISKLKTAASLGQTQLESLLTEEQRKPVRAAETTSRSFWRNVVEVAAVAAVIFVVTGVAFPTLNNMRQRARITAACKSQLKGISEGIAMYSDDHNGSLPSVATAAGAPWWKVGDQGAKNQSNTRPLWLLVKNGYVDGKSFVCPGRKDAKQVKLDFANIEKHNDFPGRQYVNYSFMFMCDKVAKQQKSLANTVVMADLNPVFERIFDKASGLKSNPIRLNEQMLKMLSTNHGQRGQNILFGDGRVVFAKSRIVNGDDIYTVKGANVYSGCEVPSGTDDIFLAP